MRRQGGEILPFSDPVVGRHSGPDEAVEPGGADQRAHARGEPQVPIGGPAQAGHLLHQQVQLGALLSAVWYYRRTIGETLVGIVQKRPESLRLLRNLVLGSLPLLAVGYLLGKRIKAQLFSPLPVALALGVGGLLMLVVERYRLRKTATFSTPDALPTQNALVVGICHLLALWPGTSRSLASRTRGP